MKKLSLLCLKTFKSLSDNTIIKILYLLSQKECSVIEIAETFGMHQSTVSHQLSFLKHLRIIKFRREGSTIYYSHDDNHILDLLQQAVEHACHC